ncbi:MAG: glutathione peroxidase [Myxococcales bacterium]|nr:glutathione peroxidase [Myxococcales bacterium]
MAVLVAVAGCSSTETQTPSGGQTASSSSGGSSGAKPGPVPTGTPTSDPGPGPAACSGAAGELYALTSKSIALEDVPLCRYKGEVLLIVNGASDCGYTPQYAPLQAMYVKYKAQGFDVLAFPSKSFNQERGTEKEVSEFCTKEYGITFPLFQIGWVVDRPAQGEPIRAEYKWLMAQPGMDSPVAWNFEKFLIGRDGKVAKRFLTAVEPDSKEVTDAIEAELAKPR